MFKAVITAFAFAIFFGIAIVFVLWPRIVQTYDLKDIGDPNQVSGRFPDGLKPLAKKAKRLFYSSKAGPEYLEVLRLIGVLWIAIMMIALILILWRHL